MGQRMLRWLHKRSGRRQGERLSAWALLLKRLLFPVNGLFWALSEFNDGYRSETDTWCINGVHYSAEGLELLARANGAMYKVTRYGNTVTLEYRGREA